MKLSQLKKIIKESLRELRSRKGLLTEACTVMHEVREALCECTGTGQSGTCQGTETYHRFSNCNTITSQDCGCCLGMTGPRRGGERAPQDIGM